MVRAGEYLGERTDVGWGDIRVEQAARSWPMPGDVKRRLPGVTKCNQSCTHDVVATSASNVIFCSCVTTDSKEDRLGSPGDCCQVRRIDKLPVPIRGRVR